MASGQTVYFWLTMAVAMLVGLWAWAWRSPARMGKLMFCWPVLLLAADLPSAYPDSSLVSTVGLGTLVFGYIVFAQMALSYPTGKLLPGRLAWVYVFILGYLAQAIQNVVNMLFYDARGCPFCPPRSPDPHPRRRAPVLARDMEQRLVHLRHGHPPDWALRALEGVRPGRRRRQAVDRASRRDRHVHHMHVLDLLIRSPHRQATALAPLSWVQTTGELVAALTALLGLAIVHRVRGSVGDLVVELDRAGPGGVRRALAAGRRRSLARARPVAARAACLGR